MAKKSTVSVKASFGSCEYATTSPKATDMAASHKAVNIRITFEEALKLNLALEEAVRKLNSYNRSSQAAKRQGVNLCVFFDKPRITVREETLAKPNSSR